jgi:SAM-dependent methyltransferase
MTLTCTTRVRSAYETGRLAEGDAGLFRPGGLELTARAIALAHLGPGATVLDLGCGAGDTMRYLHSLGIDGVGVDCADNPATPETRSPDTFKRIVARAEALPLADGSVHGVLSECSFSLFQDRELALAECARVLVDGGKLMISDLYTRSPDAVAQVRSLRGSCAACLLVRDELEAILSKAGFTMNVWEDHSTALRECAARFLFERGTLDGLWGCGGGESSQMIQAEMRAARAGYFLLVATRRKRQARAGGESDE